MIRKTIIALTAIAAMAGAALAPTSASAHFNHWHGYHGYHGHYGYGWFGPGLVAGALLTGAVIAEDSCYRERWIKTPAGPRKIIVDVC